MKKNIKKLGLLSIIIAIFIPFTRLPEVKAANDCTTHLQNYLFLDVDSEGEYLKTGGYRTYGTFDNTFPKTGTVRILSTDYNYVTDATSLNHYYYLFRLTQASGISGDAYTILNKNRNKSVYDTNIGYVNTIGSTSKYDDITILAHGEWAKESGKTYWSDWSAFDAGSKAIQIELKNLGLTSSDVSDVIIGGGKYNRSLYSFDYNDKYYDSSTELIEYLQSMVDSNSDSIDLSIVRTLDINDVKNIKAGYYINTNEYKGYDDGYIGAYADKTIFTTYSSETNLTTEPSSFFKVFKDSTGSTAGDKIHYYWPFVLSVEYEVCPTSTTGKWTVKYDLNVTDDSASNKPDDQTEAIGTDIVVSTSEPSRKDYKFLKWCTESNGSGTCYAAGDKIESPTTTEVKTLYAQWGTTETGNNNKTGIVSYVIGFISVGLIAGAIYLVSKRKNLFKQI